jgi:hypothetical protein
VAVVHRSNKQGHSIKTQNNIADTIWETLCHDLKALNND